jgi:dTMP kinase
MNLEMIIAFEGTDGSGKGTQAKMLQKYFEESGKNAVILDFPQYSTPTGKKIKEYLSGEKKLSPIEIAKLFYDDQLAQKDKINELVKNGQ